MKPIEPTHAQATPWQELGRQCGFIGREQGAASRVAGAAGAMPASTRPAAGWPRGRRGFALVVTLSLMILLTIIAVGLLTLSSVALRTSAQSQDLQTARANARLALMIAIGELQKSIGPDQRVTAPADLKSPPTSTTPATMPQWVGVYGNAQSANYSEAPATVSYQPTLLNWLVSGNETASYTFSRTASNFGKITAPPGAISFNPTDSVSNIASAGALSSNLTINGRKAALLVGPNSAGAYDASQKQFVAAPVVASKNSSNQSTGGYAYWVGDEGIKARINLRDNFRQQTTTAEITKAKSYSFISQRSGIEVMRRDLSKTSSIGKDYDPASDQIHKLVSTGEFPLLNNATLQSVAKARFHDISAHSSSVLADCYAGGLKRDLSATLQATTPPSAESIFTPVSTADFGLPTWGLLRSWSQLKAARNSPATPSAIAPQPYDPVAKTAAFGPVISTCVLGLGMEQGETTNALRIQLFPTLILWNPHAAPIQAANYELGMAVRNGGSVNIKLKNKSGAWISWGYFSLARGDRPTIVTDPQTAASDAASGSGFFRFKVEGSEIPPGESHIYVLKPSLDKTPYDPAGGSTLVRANASLPTGTTRYLTGPSFSYAPAQLYADGDPTATPAGIRTELRLFTTDTGMSVGPSDGAANNLMGLAGDRFEAVLTSAGALGSGFTATTPVYQAILENCATPYLHGPKNLQDFRIYLHDPNNPLASDPGLGLAPIFAIRSKMVMEGHNNNSHAPHTGAMGMQGSNRWIATANPLAPYTKRTKAEYAYNGGNPVQGSALVNYWDKAFNHFLGMSPNNTPSYIAAAGIDQTGGGGQQPTILKDVLPDDLPLLSLGQLQHAPLSTYGFAPTYCFGNSKVDLRIIDRRYSYLPRYVALPGAAPTAFSDTLYDMPWHLNRALWDRYFVSSVPDDLTQSDIEQGKPLPNARMTYVRSQGKAPELSDIQSSSSASMIRAAANLMVAGGFNINSTSVDAWRAVLTGTNQAPPSKEFAHPDFQQAEGFNVLMPRFARDVRTSNNIDATGVLNRVDVKTLYNGNRELVLLKGKDASGVLETPEKAAARLPGVAGELAEKIVAEVRDRGPFLSLADFINRDLVTGEKGLRGALQAAIDKCATPNEVNSNAAYASATLNYAGMLSAAGKKIAEYDLEAYLGGPTTDPFTAVSGYNAPSYRLPRDQAPKFLTQADILTTLGPALSARSDTFVIRSYGEATNPQTGLRSAGAWCEAVIQRTPDYVDSADDATVLPGALTSETNKTFGRALTIISFRWLSADEI